jgi:hypothetical protein
MGKKKDTESSKTIEVLKIQNEVLHIENNNLKIDVDDLKRVIVSQAFEIERLRGMSKVNQKYQEIDNIIEKHNANYNEYKILDDGNISHLDHEDDSE